MFVDWFLAILQHGSVDHFARFLKHFQINKQVPTWVVNSTRLLAIFPRSRSRSRSTVRALSEGARKSERNAPVKINGNSSDCQAYTRCETSSLNSCRLLWVTVRLMSLTFVAFAASDSIAIFSSNFERRITYGSAQTARQWISYSLVCFFCRPVCLTLCLSVCLLAASLLAHR